MTLLLQVGALLSLSLLASADVHLLCFVLIALSDSHPAFVGACVTPSSVVLSIGDARRTYMFAV